VTEERDRVASSVRAAVRIVHTIRHLQPEQVAQRALRRVRRRRGPAAVPAGVVVARDGFGPRAPRCRRPAEAGVLEGEFQFWGVQRRLPLDRVWAAPDLGLSWNYPLHYHDALPALADLPDLRSGVCRFVDAWIASHPPGTGCAWDPYPTALRIVNWLDVVATLGADADPAWRTRVRESVWVQAAWLERRLERHLLGTHLLKDAKALAIAGAAFAGAAAARWRRRAHAILRRELGRQVRADGGHVEPSVAYHALATEDVLDLLAFDLDADAPLRAALGGTAERMLAYLAAVATPAGGIPLLGDSGADAAPAPQALLDFATRLGITPAPVRSGGGVRWLADSALAVYRDARQYVLADAGGVGPPHLSAHGHCDSLSFEWWVDGVPIVVDTGTTSYESGAARDACRATRAHNTLEIDGQEQHEIWAAFRVGRRSRVRARLEGAALVASLRPWHARRLRVERRFEFDAGALHIADRVDGRGRHTVASRLHFHPDCELDRDGNVVRIRHGRASAHIELEAPFTLHDAATSGSVHCERLGVARPNAVLELRGDAVPWSGALHLRLGHR
jgi:uncharacterized heparinase superfamily protein